MAVRGIGELGARFKFFLPIMYLLCFQVESTVTVNSTAETQPAVLYNQSLPRNSTLGITDVQSMSRSIRSNELQPPRNLQIDPSEFGALKISWHPPDSQILLEAYEIILKNLTSSEEIQARKCRHLQSVVGNGSLQMKVLGTDTSAYFGNLIPDTFYRVDVFALSEDERSAPASLSSSPLVPGIPPTLPPDKVSVDVVSAQTTRVTWIIPDNIECEGALLYFILEVNSTYDSSQIIKVEKNATSCALIDLMPGVEYSVRICASNRAGLGRYSKAVVFRNKGQQRELDMEAFEPTEFPPYDFDDDQESLPESESEGFNFNVHNFLIPEEILNFRGKGLKSAIELSWSVKWRPMYPLPAGEEFGAAGKESAQQQQPLPGVMFRLLWGEKYAGPAEDVITGTLTRHTIQGLRAGTNYHIRIITIVPGGEGPAAYTVAMTARHNEEEPSMSGHHPIPVNLRVNSVAQTHAEIGWELPMPYREYPPSTLHSLIAGFQVKYYQVEQLGTFRSGGPTSSILRRLQLLNVTGATSSRALLQRLRPETAYEFTVCALPVFPAFPEGSQSSLESSEWSMVQGFETLGQRPLNPPGLIKINKVSTEHDFTDTLSPLPTHTTNPWFPDDPPSGDPGRHDVVDAAILVTWSAAPPEDGLMIAYRVYLTRNIYQNNAQWKEHIVPGDQNSTIIRALRPGQLYFLRMTSQNRHGLSPVSPVFVFRTAKANGQGFFSLKLPKEYLNDRKLTPRRLERLLNRLDAWNSRNTETWTDPEDKEVVIEAKSLHWLILCAILAAVVVIVLLIVLTLVCRCRGRSTRRSTASAKYARL